MATRHDLLPFVGRRTELAKFREMLDSRDGLWLMWVVGPAGQGKSKFLEACLAECEERKIKHSGIIDFFNDGLRTRWGVITELAKRFHVESNTEYKKAFEQYQDEVIKGDGADRDVLQFSLNRAEEALVNAICPKRPGKPRVILVDTVEEIVENLGSWFFDKFLVKLFPHFRVVAGGRRVPTVAEGTSWRGEKPYHCQLRGLEISDVRNYLQEVNLLPEMEPYIDGLYEKTRGDGQALLVALAANALNEGRLKPEELANIKKKDFEKSLVIDPHLPHTVENAIILEMAHVYHGYTPDTLRLRPYSLSQLGCPSYEIFLENLTRYPYIKYHADTDTTRLHDYFRERLLDTRWTDDLELTVRAGISEQLASYFEKRIRELLSGGDRATSDLDTLRHQWIYHLLFSNRERAYGELWELLDISWHAFKFDYMNSLLDMVQDVNLILRRVGKFDNVLDRLEKAARTWMGLEIWETAKALELAEDVVRDSGDVRRLELTALVAKATALGRQGQFDESVKILREAYDGYNELLEIAKRAEAGESGAKEALSSEHGIVTVHGILPERYLILNTIGVLLRNKGFYDEAEKEFATSYKLAHDEGDLNWQASAATQLGTILRYKGDYSNAADRIHQGLALRRRSGQRGREAFSLQALGMLQRDEGKLREARDSLLQAYEIWKELHAETYMAAAARNLGWVAYLEHEYDTAENYYTQAERVYMQRKLDRELPNLRQKQGELWIARAGRLEEEKEQCLKKAEGYLLEGLRLGDIHDQPLYTALCLVELCRIAGMKGEYHRMPEWEQRLRKFESDGFHYEPAYADLEEILGKKAQSEANITSNINYQQFDVAVDHFCKMFVYLVRFSSVRYQRRREFLREWLPSLPDELRHRACKRLIECWESYPDLATSHRGFIATVQSMDEL